MRNFIFLFLALFILFIFGLPIFIFQVLRYTYRNENLISWFKSLAISIDYIGATLIYSTEGHTISAIAYKKYIKGDKLHKYVKIIIDKLFYDGHCKESYEYEYIYKAQEGVI